MLIITHQIKQAFNRHKHYFTTTNDRMSNMAISIIAENSTDYIRRHIPQEKDEQGFQQDLGFYP